MAKQVCVAENDMTKCTGCMVCVDACPVNAIKESFTKDGFRIPNVQGDKCVKCGRCMRVCSLNAEKNCLNQSQYTAWRQMIIRLECIALLVVCLRF